MSLLLSGVVGLEFWLASFAPIPLIDKMGRRPLLLLGAVGQCVSMVIIAATVAYPNNKICGYVSIVFILYVSCVALTFSPLFLFF